MKSCVKAAMILLLLVAAAPSRTSSQDAFNVKELLQKDISKYARGDMLLSLAEITVARGIPLAVPVLSVIAC